jgi:hypothetical protein
MITLQLLIVTYFIGKHLYESQLLKDHLKFSLFSLQYASTQVQGLKEGMSQLEKIQSELAEFFCEEAACFKIDECFKSFSSFIAKLKQVLLAIIFLPKSLGVGWGWGVRVSGQYC